MPDSASLYEEEEDDEYSDNNSERTEDTLDRLLENYTFSFKPEVRLKWHKRISQFGLTAAYTKPWEGPWQWRLMLKPEGDPKWASYLRRILVVPTQSLLALSTPKLRLGMFRLQFDVFYDLKCKKVGLDYRLTTKWSEGTRLKSKVEYKPVRGVLLRAKHLMHWDPPAMSGHIGADPDEDVQDNNLLGEFDLKITQLDFKFDLP